MIRLEWTLHRNTQVLGLVAGQLGQLDVKGAQMAEGDLLIQLLGQHENSNLVFARVAPELELGQHLVAEAVRHDEAGMTHSTAKIDQPTLRQQDDVLAVGQSVSVNLRLNIGLGLAVLLQPLDLDLTVKMTNVAYNGVVLHLEEVLASQDVLATGGGHKDVASGDGILDSGDLVSLHGCLQRVDGVNLGDDDTAAETAQRHGAALADISVAGNKSDLSG